MKYKPLLITGGSGYLGQHLTPQAAEKFDVYATYNTHANQIKSGRPISLNLIDRDDVFRTITELKPQAIIHAAAINPGMGSEQDMMRINRDGSRYVAEAALENKARLIHVSTDVVHDGKQAPYDDDAPPNPLNGYGRSKAAAEAAIAEIDPRAAIVRTSLIYGLDVLDRGTEGFAKRLNSGEPLTLFNDVIRQPVWVESLATALLKLVDVGFEGPLNIAGSQALTREQFGRRMLAWWQVDTRGLLGSGRAVDISDTIPLDLRMSIHKSEQLLQMPFPGVDEVLTISKRG